MKKTFLLLVSIILPLSVLAAGPTLNDIIIALRTKVLTPLVAVLLTLALLAFFWGMIKYIKSLGSEKDKKDGKELMVWGIVALFVMVSVWGLVGLITGTLGFTDTNRQAPSPIVLPGTTGAGNSRNNSNNTGDWALYE